MAIIETKLAIRPNATIPFFSQTDNPKLVALKAAFDVSTSLVDTELYQKRTNASGSHIIERSYSEDLLTQTTKMTFDSLATWSHIDTLTGISHDREYKNYTETNNFLFPTLTSQYTVTGIDSSFTCTTTYNYTSGVTEGYPLFESFISVIEVSDKLTSFTNTGTQLIAVHTYDNSADFSENHWRDWNFVIALNNGGITRTISYASVTTP